jgi:CRP-like cAMP-binding protein
MTKMPGISIADGISDTIRQHFEPIPQAGRVHGPEADFFQAYGEVRTFRKGAVLFRQGADPRGVYLLVQGKVKVCRNLAPGQRQIFFFHGPGDLLGCRQVIAGTAGSFQTECLENCQTLFVPAEIFVQHTRQSPAFAHHLLEQQSREFSAWTHNCALVARRSVRERLAVCLLYLDRLYQVPPNHTSVICLSRTDLADFAATTLESTVRVLREMKDAGLLHIRGRRIVLLDVPAMVRISTPSGLKKVEA